ncbi:MAG: pirin family protein [Agrococcus casei]|uniref:pirin family protein n=1 Tax=Agrococcus casei TaxID=343512 RepID=UPI003F8E48B1
MSNDEATTIEGAAEACIEQAREQGVELLLPRVVPLGRPRAIPVSRVLPNKHRHFIGAWCFADAFGPADRAEYGAMDVPPHPHTGLQTVSYLVEGGVEHRDSTGQKHTVRPGGVNVMTAGRGISHSEYQAADADVLHGVQLWTVLPSGERGREPSFSGVDAVPAFELAAGVEAQVFAGSYLGHTADAPYFSPLVGVGLRIRAGEVVTLPLERGFEHGVLALNDGVFVLGDDDARVPVLNGGMAYFAPGTEQAVVVAETDAVIVLIGGEPFEEEVVMFWNFIGESHDEVLEFRERWMRERAEEEAREQFGTVVDDEARPLAAPRLPAVELLPRGRARRR